MSQTPPDASDAHIASGLQHLQIPAHAKNYIIIGGEPHTIDGAYCVTFKDDPAWDFMRGASAGESAPLEDRRNPTTGQLLTTVEQLQDHLRGILIHTDITSDSAGCFRVLIQRALSTHFMVDWNGVIYQGADPVKMAKHGGGAENTLQYTNFHTIGIDMNCMLVNLHGDAVPAASKGRRRIFEGVINGSRWRGLGYTDAQYDALVKLLRALKQRFTKIQLMPPIGPDKQVLMEQTEIDLEKCGLFGHFHVNAQKGDPGPGFEWQRLIADLNRQANSFPVVLERAKDGKAKNIDSVYAESEVGKLAEVYYRNSEDPTDGSTGGFFPVGAAGQWHGGVHLHLPAGSPVLAMFPGRVVAAKTSAPGSPEPPFGSNNFVLMRHEIAVDDGDPTSRKFKFWSLYMHLQGWDSQTDKTLAQALIDNPKLGEADQQIIAPDWVHLLRLALAGKKPEDEAAEAAVAEPAAKKAKGTAKDHAKDHAKDDGAAKKAEGAENADDAEQPENDEDDPFLDVGKNLEALQNGQIALIEDRYPVWVKVGDTIGRVGEFGDTDSKSGVVHIEVFCDGGFREFMDLLGAHADNWIEANPDPSDDLNCDDGELLRAMLPEQSGRSRRKIKDFIDAGRRISGDQVVDFYRQLPGDVPAVERMRKTITFHVSEWSDQVDWFKSLAKAQDWPGKTSEISQLLKDSKGGWSSRLFAAQIRRQLPYIWLTEDVAKHIGLDVPKGGWDGHLYHFHPVNFLTWLTFRFGTNKMKVRATADRMSEAKQKEYRKKQEQAEAEQRERGELEFGEDSLPEGGGELDPPEDVLRDLWDTPRQPNEWKLREE